MSPQKLTINSYVKLASGHSMPLLGFGVYQTPPAETEAAALSALQNGYRHIDSAQMYRNEVGCSSAISKSKIPRSKIFLTSKINTLTTLGYEASATSITESLQKTGLDYFDLFLIHAPKGNVADRNGCWKALVEAQAAGKIRDIGVSNYGLHHLRELEVYMKELEKERGNGGKISVAQYELHPWCGRAEIVEWLRQRDVVIQAYCPLVRAQRMEEPELQQLAKKYGKTPAQILVRWSLQKGFVPLPKSVTPSRIAENADVYDFELTAEEVETLSTDDHSPCAWDPTLWRD